MACTKGTFASRHAPWGHSHHGIPTRGHLHHCIPTRVHSHHGMHHKNIHITAYPQGYISIMAYSQEDIRIMAYSQANVRIMACIKGASTSLHTRKGHLHQNICIMTYPQVDICTMTYPLEDCRISIFVRRHLHHSLNARTNIIMNKFCISSPHRTLAL